MPGNLFNLQVVNCHHPWVVADGWWLLLLVADLVARMATLLVTPQGGRWGRTGRPNKFNQRK